MRNRDFQQVNVFAGDPLMGNPLAVVADGADLSAEEMQRFARWTNLSETVLLLPPTDSAADYRVRIFSLARELPFAGHPTLGSCHAWLAAGGDARSPKLVVQECQAGLVPVKKLDRQLFFASPPLRREGPVESQPLNEIVEVLGLKRYEIMDASWVDNGPGWVAVMLADAGTVLGLEPEPGPVTGPKSLDIGVVGPYPPGSEWAFEVRAFFTDERGWIREDPITGSLNASLGQWLIATGRAQPPYVARQGTRLGRAGRVKVDRDAGGVVWVGGDTTTVIEGTVRL